MKNALRQVYLLILILLSLLQLRLAHADQAQGHELVHMVNLR